MSLSRQVRRQMERDAAKPSRTIKHVLRRSDLPENKPGKGRFDENCNRTACQAPIAGRNFFNTSTRAYYCPTCANLINNESRRFDGIAICVAVQTSDERPEYPYEESKKFREQREARRQRLAAPAR